MSLRNSALCLFAFLSVVKGGTVIWSGNFNSYANVSAFDQWSWSNQVGEYQWYIHGTQPTSHYLATGSAYKNPADTWESVGLRLTIDTSAVWNSDGMERSELIPQTTANLGSGQLYYHFSLYLDPNNLPDSTVEHQIFFFESHSVQLKYGVSPSPTSLVFLVGSTTYVVPTTAGTWLNFAYDLNFSGGAAGLWFSTGSNALTRVVSPVSTGLSTNSEDFHVGVLKLGVSGNPEVFYISGVYIESGSITTSVAGPGTSGGSTTGGSSTGTTTTTTTSSSSSSSSSSSVKTTTTTTTTTTAGGVCVTQYGQCGGIGYTGSTTCCSPATCKVGNPYYSQCLT